MTRDPTRPYGQPASKLGIFSGSVGGALDVQSAPVGFDPGPPPTSFTYNVSSLSLTVGVPMDPMIPVVTGRRANYFTVVTGTPPDGSDVGLPPGIELDRNTGIVSGTPTEIWDPTIYRFGAWSGGNAADCSVSIEVFDDVIITPPPPTGIGTGGVPLNSYTGFGQTITFEDALTPGAPVITGEFFVNGSARLWMSAPNGVRFLTKTPPYQNKGSFTFKGQQYVWHKNGTQEEKLASDSFQAFDSTCFQNGSYNAPAYSHVRNLGVDLAAGPIIFTGTPQGHTIMFGASRDFPFQRPQLYSILQVTVYSTLGPEVGPDAFAPTYARNPTGGAKPSMLYKAGDIDWTRVPNLAIPSDPNQLIPTWAKIEALFDGGWYEGVGDSSTILCQFCHPLIQMRAYGRDVQGELAQAFAKVFLAYPQAEKEYTVRSLVQLGLDRYRLSVWDRYNANKGLGPSGHWGQNAGQAFEAQFCILFAGLLLHDTAMINEAKMVVPYTASTTQQWQCSNQYFKVYTTPGNPSQTMWGICGFGPIPAGATGEWAQVGAAHWAIAENEQRHQGLPTIAGGKLYDTLAAWADKQGHPLWPKTAGGVACPRGQNNGNNALSYHQVAGATHWMWNLGSRIFDKMGLIVMTDYYPSAMYHSMRNYIQRNGQWGYGSEAPVPAKVTHSENFWEQTTGPTGNAGIVKLTWGTYGVDEITYPIPAL